MARVSWRLTSIALIDTSICLNHSFVYWKLIEEESLLIPLLMWQYITGRPPLSQPTKLLMTIRIVLQFFSSLARGISQSFTNTKYTTERVEGKKNNHRLGLAPNARRSLWHFYAALCEFVGYCERVFTQNSHKPLGMLTYLLTLVYLASVGQQVLAAAFLTSVD